MAFLPSLHFRAAPVIALAAAVFLGTPTSLLAAQASNYTLAPAFGGLAFQEPVQVVFAPGETSRAFVVERAGRITVIPDLVNPTRVVLLDLSSSVNNPSDNQHGMLSMVFHPNFAQNGYFYLWTSLYDSSGNRFTQLMRYTLSSSGTVDPASQLILFSQPVGPGGHDGGELLFGTDGYLYLSIGDGDFGVSGAEAIASHQRIDKGFFGAVLRIDVDKKPGNLAANPHLGQPLTNYLIPADNPYVGATSFNGTPVDPTQVRTEFWAMGFRNPFRMSFDPVSNQLWAGDVGLDTEEELDVVTAGSNYGWNYWEGTIPGDATTSPPAGTTFTFPIWEYNHSNGDECITAGIFYHGAAFPELTGQYVFGDYISGRIWTVSDPMTQPIQSSQVTLIGQLPGIVSLAVQPGTGDILFSNITAGKIEKLVSLVAPSAPAIVLQPSSSTIAAGSTAAFNVEATGIPSPGYQWSFNGSPISGATDATLVISGASPINTGSYTCAISNASGSVTTAPASLTVAATSDPGRLINLSVRAQVGTGSNLLIPGFVIGGSGSEPVLIRASGPALVSKGVTGILPDPRMQLYAGSTQLDFNSGWAGNAEITSTAAAVGAQPWTDPSSLDSALLETLAPGAYTTLISGVSGDSGLCLAEIYDASPAGSYTPAGPRLINISGRAQVGTGGNILIAGFVIAGSTSATVLIRASGPALISQGVTGILSDPTVTLYSGSTPFASNSGWGGRSEIASAAASVGAQPWPDSASHDSAFLVTLPPGGYTVLISGESGDTGVALAEVYAIQ